MPERMRKGESADAVRAAAKKAGGHEVDAVADPGGDGREDVGEVAAELVGAQRPGRRGDEEPGLDGVRPEKPAADERGDDGGADGKSD